MDEISETRIAPASSSAKSRHARGLLAKRAEVIAEQDLRACAQAINAARALMAQGCLEPDLDKKLRVARMHLGMADERLLGLNSDKHFILFEAAPVVRKRRESLESEVRGLRLGSLHRDR